MEELQAGSHPYEFGPCLGHGAFGSVFQCRNRETWQECAVKVIKKTEFSGNVEAVFKEVQILASSQHEHIVEFRQLLEFEHHILIEMELMSGGTLQSRLEGNSLCDSEKPEIFREILSAVSYLHSRDIVHRDLKPDNVLFKSPTSAFPVKITDFGLSEKFEDVIWTKSLLETCGTLAFMAPEQASSTHYSRPVDIWSCGIILYMLITGHHPLLSDSDSSEDYFHKLQTPHWSFPSDFPDLAKDLFLRLVAFHPLDRYTAEEALRHPWVTCSGSDIPKTYIERLSEYNERTKVWQIGMKLCALGCVIARGNEEVVRMYREKIERPKGMKTKPKVVISQPAEDAGNRPRKGSFIKTKSSFFSPTPSPVSATKTLLASHSTFARLGISPVQSPVKTRGKSPNSARPSQRFFA